MRIGLAFGWRSISARLGLLSLHYRKRTSCRFTMSRLPAVTKLLARELSMTNSAYSDDTAPARSTDALLSEASTALPMSLIGSLPRIFAAVVLAGALGAGPAPVPVMAAWGTRREEPATASSVF